MLKRLELVGFKSFADKTVFDFGDGITAVVGPNGSGKSNIVDAVRWILGEQSAKSLRGGEMADVIFNGSASRRSFSTAEVTMTLDNARRLLSTPADEVQITRRVYRSGEGEYLINQQPCRLRDIKELFLGSGAGHDAYCIIEQGRVDVLLQASTKERRTIFEEAAAISRFKAKKLETLRKLERVDQNVLRLRDIIEEVERQLRSVKLQAAKAQRYQEYSSRLKELRVALSLDEYHELTQRLEAESAVLEGLRVELAERSAQASSWEAEMQRLEATVTRLDDVLHEQEGQLATARAQITGAETTLGHEAALSEELGTELSRTRARQSELNANVVALTAAVAGARDEVAGSENHAEGQRQDLQRLEAYLQQTLQRLGQVRLQIDTDKAEHLEQMRRAALLQNDTAGCKAQVENLRREQARFRLKSEQVGESLASLERELHGLSGADTELQERLAVARHALADQRRHHEHLCRERDEAQDLASQLRQQRSGLVSRVEVLEALERSHEGLGAGVREVFQLFEQPEPGPWRTVLGMIADFLTVEREFAPLIDLVLGDCLQRFVVRDAAALDQALAQRTEPFASRVTFVPLSQERRKVQADRLPASALVNGFIEHPGVVSAAHRVVTCEHPELADLPAQLLSSTLIVRDLNAGRAIAAHALGYRLVTLDGELLEPDGTLTVGRQHADTGILSRKSELRELRRQILALDFRIAEAEEDLVQLRQELTDLEQRSAAQQHEIDGVAEQATDLRARLQGQQDRRQGLQDEVTVRRDEMHHLEGEIAAHEDAWQAASRAVAAAEAQVLNLQARMASAEQEIRELEQTRAHGEQECTTAKVALATVEERLSALRAHLRQVDHDLAQHRRQAAEGEDNLHVCQMRLQGSQLTMLEASAALARGHLEKEAAERRVAELTLERNQQRLERSRLASQAQTLRSQWRDQQEQVHARELEINDLQHQRDSLTLRLREDYQVELAELYRQGLFSRESQSSADSVRADASRSNLDAAAANEEIAELRRKLSRLGSVNLEALDELGGLETRAATLQAQQEDLAAAKRALEEIISKINQDSRRLFIESFTAIRTHFQELFRKLFGGGMADIVLEDETDVLESGIEIIARPPGKELRSISLMSGGEKTLTAVALLLAIFRSKPSPFCILDEVDAALDEANIGRFTAVLREFLDRSQFILVTHSKRTMTCADVLYGITMQESGISKRVAVRFEDWPDDSNNAAAPPAADRNGHSSSDLPVRDDSTAVA